jgi:hypothetical protein
MSRRSQNRPQESRGVPVRASESVSAPVVAPEPPAAPVEPADAVPPAPERVRFRARVRIHAGVTYERGEEIPETVAMDGLTEGVEYERG